MIDNDTHGFIRRRLIFISYGDSRQTHSSPDYGRMAAPYLLQIQERQQQVLIYLSANPTAVDA